MNFKARGVLVVGFVGKAGSGKTSVAQAVTTAVFSFATGLKEIAKLLGWDGKKDARGRRLLQHLGDVGREYQENLWIKNLEKDMYRQLMDDTFYGDISIYGIDDVRYDNECQFIKDKDGIIIKLQHDKVVLDKKLSKHQSEAGVSPEYIDYTIPWGKLEDVIREAGAIIKLEYERRTSTFNTLRTSKIQAQA